MEKLSVEKKHVDGLKRLPSFPREEIYNTVPNFERLSWNLQHDLSLSVAKLSPIIITKTS